MPRFIAPPPGYRSSTRWAVTFEASYESVELSYSYNALLTVSHC